jgi:hypothetical protein
MTLLLQHADYRRLWECRRLPHPITVRGNLWLAVLRIGPWSLILAQRGTP